MATASSSRCRAGRAREGLIRRPRAQQAAPLPTVRRVPASARASAGSCTTCDPAVLPRAGHRTAGLVERIRAVSRPGPFTASTRLEPLPRHRLSRASTVQREVSKPARPPRRPTRIRSRPKTAFTTTSAPPSHGIPGPQAEARSPTESDSEDSAPRHMASFRRQLRRTSRRPSDSSSRATRAGTRPHQRRKGVVSCSEIASGSSSAIRTRSSVRRKSTS